jgi:cytochrome c-type biogenesis protein CcmF
VRSGVLTSVHAFATDPERGVYILGILVVFLGGALTLYAVRASSMATSGIFGIVSRESGLVLNNILLAVAAFVVFIGTIWPLVAEMLLGRKLSVGAPFFDAAFSPFMVALAVILPPGAMLAWKRGNLARVMRPLWGIIVLAVALAGLAFALQTGRSALGPVGVALGVWVVGGAKVDLWTRTGRGPIISRIGRLWRLPRADWGKTLAHMGLGITIFGVAALTAWQQEDIRTARIGDKFTVGAWEIELRDVHSEQGPNYVATMAEMVVWRDGAEFATLYPEKRFYPVASMPTTEAAIHNGILRDLYLVIGDPQDDGGYAVRTYIKPFANWIWGGAMLMALGGLVSLSDRRLRVATGAVRRDRAGVPAE